MRRQTTAFVLVICLAASGCASAPMHAQIAQPQRSGPVEHDRLAEYVQRLPVGSRVRIERTTGRTIHGTLIAAGSGVVVVQRATRIPEPPLSVPLGDVARIEVEERSNLARAIIIGTAAGAGAALGVFLLLAAALGD